MGNPIIVSIILPTYNRAGVICRALNSLTNQTYKDWECIIVDDGSEDNSEEIISDYIARDKRFNYYKIENGGTARARNFGVEKATGTLLLPLDSDDYIGPTYIEKGVQIFLTAPNITLVYCRATFIDSENTTWSLPDYSYKLLLVYNMIFNSSIFKKEDFIAVGGYNEDSKLEDWDLWIRLLRNDGHVHQIKEPLFFCGINQNYSITTSLHTNDEKMEAQLNKLYKNNIDIYLKQLGNPIQLERQLREYKSIIKQSDTKLALRFVKSWPIKSIRKIRGVIKRISIK